MSSVIKFATFPVNAVLKNVWMWPFAMAAIRGAWTFGLLASSVALALSICTAIAGDSIYGKVIAVKGPDVVVLDYGSGQYDVRIVGVDAPTERTLADEAANVLSDLVLNKNVRLRLVGRAENGELVAQLATDDPQIGIKDVAIELVKSGVVRRQAGYDYKYGELSSAENEAKSAKRGLWVTPPQ